MLRVTFRMMLHILLLELREESRERAIERFAARALETVTKVSEKHARRLDG